MRRCEYCGGQYADKVTLCPVDGQATVNPEAKPQVVGGGDRTQVAFNAKVVSPLAAAGSYRVFVRGGDLLFIQIESETSSVLSALAPFLGPAGGVIPLLTWLFCRRMAKDYLARLETDDPENLLRDHAKNFRLHLAEIREAELAPPPRLGFSGKAIGSITLWLRHSEQLKLVMAKREDMEALRQLLAPTLRAALRVMAEWSVTADQYEQLPAQKH